MARKAVKKIEKVFGKEIQASETYYLGDKALPTAESQYEWTPEMVSSMKKSMKDVTYFASTFFTIIDNSDKTERKTIELRDYQKRILESMTKNNRLILLCSRQVGKCVCGNTKIICRFKWFPIPFKIKISTFYKIQKFISKLEGMQYDQFNSKNKTSF